MNPISFSHITLKKPRKVRQPSLFNPDFSFVAQNICPKSLTKLYWNRARTGIMCKKKGCNFYLPKATYDDIISGKRLKDYLEHDKMMKR